MTDEQRDAHAKDHQRPDLAEKMADEIDWTMELADDPDFAAQIRGWKQ